MALRAMYHGGHWLNVFLNVCSCVKKKQHKQRESKVNDKERKIFVLIKV